MMMTPDERREFTVRPIAPHDAAWVRETIAAFGGGEPIITPGGHHYPTRLHGFLAEATDGRRIGLLTYMVQGDACEIVTLEAKEKGIGVGTALMEAAADAARRAGCRRLFLFTTNDNLAALAFYQRHGLALAALHRDAMDEVRRVKPWLPAMGEHGIPMRDLLELEQLLAPEGHEGL